MGCVQRQPKEWTCATECGEMGQENDYVRLEKPEVGDGTFSLVMSPVEWQEIHALAKFAQASITYNAQAAYVAQVVTYMWSQPQALR